MCTLGDLLGEDMLFYTFEEFMSSRKYIKETLEKKDNKYKVIYGLYVESRPFIKDYFRGVIRDYINDYINDAMLLNEYLKYKSSKRKGGRRE